MGGESERARERESESERARGKGSIERPESPFLTLNAAWEASAEVGLVVNRYSPPRFRLVCRIFLKPRVSESDGKP